MPQTAFRGRRIALLALAALPTVALSLAGQTSLAARLDRAFRDSALANRLIGAQVAVSVPGRPLWTATYGVDREGVAMTDSALLGTGSISKLLAAVAVLRLVDEGKVAWSDTLGRWFPGHANVHPGIPLRLVLRHRSGLREYGAVEGYADSLTADRNRVWRAEELLRFVGPPVFAPGAAWAASNTDRLLLGMVVDRVTGMRFGEFVRTALFRGGREVWTPGQANPDSLRPATHWTRDNTGAPVNFSAQFFGPSLFTARVETYVSARELARFAERLFRGNLLSAATRDSLLAIGPDDGRIPNETGAGMGVRRFEYFGRTFYGNSGGTANSSAFLLFDPGTGIIVSLSTNQSGPSLRQSHFRIAPALLAITLEATKKVPDPAVIYLARHGQSDYDPKQPLPPGTRPDPALTAQGRAEAESLATSLKEQGIARVVASPLLRARETGTIIARVLGVPLSIERAFAEFDPGDLLGRDWSVSPWREQFDGLMQDPSTRRPTGESADQLRARAVAGLTGLATRYRGERIVVVGHGLVNRSILGALRGEAQERALRRAAQPGTRAYRFTWPALGGAAIDSLGR
ncbi:MAG: serine hydrolase [Gemmatimonadales bacterium]